MIVIGQSALGVPDGFETWDEALEAVTEAREKQTPEQAQPKVWKAFEILAFYVIPHINE